MTHSYSPLSSIRALTDITQQLGGGGPPPSGPQPQSGQVPGLDLDFNIPRVDNILLKVMLQAATGMLALDDLVRGFERAPPTHLAKSTLHRVRIPDGIAIAHRFKGSLEGDFEVRAAPTGVRLTVPASLATATATLVHSRATSVPNPTPSSAMFDVRLSPGETFKIPLGPVGTLEVTRR